MSESDQQLFSALESDDTGNATFVPTAPLENSNISPESDIDYIAESSDSQSSTESDSNSNSDSASAPTITGCSSSQQSIGQSNSATDSDDEIEVHFSVLERLQKK